MKEILNKTTSFLDIIGLVIINIIKWIFITITTIIKKIFKTKSQKIKLVLPSLMMILVFISLTLIFTNNKPKVIATNKDSLYLYQTNNKTLYSANFARADQPNQTQTKISFFDRAIAMTPTKQTHETKKQGGNKVIAKTDEYQIVQTIQKYGIKEDIIIEKPLTHISYQINFEQLIPFKGNDGLWHFLDEETGESVFYIPQPYMVDAKGKRSEDVQIEIYDETITVIPNQKWLSAPQRKYPVTIDPTIMLEILTLHSHPKAGDEWKVSFSTQGKADLKIIPQDPSTIHEMDFISLKCGDQTRTPEILADDVILFSNWECNQTGEFIHRVNVAGDHTLKIEFGNESGYAYNNFRDDRAPIAILEGTQTDGASTNMNQGTATLLDFSSSSYNANYFSYSSGDSTKLSITKAGDYFFSFTLPLYSATARTNVEVQAFKNGVKLDLGVGRSSYARVDTSHNDTSDHLTFFLEDLAVNDYVQIKVLQEAAAGTVTATDNFTLFGRYVEDKAVYYATGTQTTNGTNLNDSTEYAMQWSTDVLKKSGFTHSTSSNSHQVTLDAAGTYLVSANIPIGSGGSARDGVRGRIKLDDTLISGGEFMQGYIRNTSGHDEASIHWSGLVQSTSASQILTVTTQREGYSGTRTVGDEKATLYIEKVDPDKVFWTEATQVNSAADWIPSSAQNINWSAKKLAGFKYFDHSTHNNNHLVTVKRPGDYLLLFNGAFKDPTGADNTNYRHAPRTIVYKNDSPLSGAISASYIRDASGHEESSNSLAFPLYNLNQGDTISLKMDSASSEYDETINDTTPAQLALIRLDPPSTHPVAYWKFDEGYGTTAYDDSKNGLNLTKTNAIWQEDNLCISGKCAYYDGSGDYFSRSDPDDLDFGTTENFTVSTWVRGTGFSTYNGILGKGGQSETGPGFEIFTGSNGTQLYFRLTWDGGPTYGINPTGAFDFTDRKWHHVSTVVNRSNNTAYIYVDGNLLITGDISSVGSLDSDLLFKVGGNGAGSWNGFIDEVKIFPYARSAAEVKQDYTSGASNQSTAEGASTSFGGDQQQNFLSEGLVGYWDMNEASANTCSGGTNDSCDSSGNGNDGAWSGNATSAAGKFGNAGSFDGDNDYVALTDTSSLSTTDSNDTITVSAWVYQTAQTNFDRVVSSDWANAGSWMLSVWSSTYRPAFSIYNGGQYNSIDSTALSLNTWNHLVGTYDGEYVRIYVNGELKNSVACSGCDIDNSDSIIRISEASSTEGFAGKIDEVRIYNRALSPVEVRKLYNWAPGPVAHWRLDEGSGTTFNDISGNLNTGTLVNSPSWKLGKYGKSIYLNGSNQYGYVADSTSLDITSTMTVSFWARRDSSSASWEELFGKGYYSGGWQELTYYAQVQNDDNLGFYMNTGSTDRVVSTDADTFPIGTWTHFSLVYDGSYMKIYQDGVEVKSTAATGAIATNNMRLGIGRDCDATCSNNASYFNGNLDDFKIYNYARSPGQIIQDMNAGHPIGGSPISSKLAHWKFDEGYGTTVNNSGTNGSTNNGTLSGTTPWNNTGKYNKSLSCAGYSAGLCGVSASTASLNLPNQFTYTAWIYQDEYGSGNPGSTGFHNHGGQWRTFSSSSNIALQMNGGSGWESSLNSSEPIPLKQWTHVAIVYDNGNAEIFYDGVSKGSTTSAPSSLIAASGSVLMLTSQNNYYEFDGKMDDIKIFSDALTPEQVKLDMNAGASSNFGTGVEEDINDDPVMYFKMDEPSGNTAYDSGSAGNNATWSSTGTWEDGKINGAGDVTGKYLVHSTTGINSTNGTFEAWVKPKSGTDDRWGVWQTHDSSSQNWVDWIWLGQWTSTVFYFRMGDGSACCTNDTTFNPTGHFPTDKWTHIAATWKGDADAVADDVMTIYVDGVQVAQRTNANFQATMDPNARIGMGHGLTADGSMDEVKLYDYARSPAQIKADAATDVINPVRAGAPVLDINLDEKTGTTAYDKSGNGINGTLQSSPDWSIGKHGAGLSFNGTSQYVTTPSNSLTNFDAEGQYTIESWVWLDQYQPNGGPGGCCGSRIARNSSGDGGFDWRIWNSGTVNFYRPTTWCAASSSETVPLKEWVHLAATYDNQQVYVYMNGKQIASANSCNFLDSTAGVDFNHPGGNHGLYGDMDGYKIYDYARTPAQVAYDYNRGKPVGHWKLDECSGTTAYDSSGNENNGTVTIGGSGSNTSAGTCSGSSGEAWNDGETGKLNSSLELDGTDDYVAADAVTSLVAGANTTVSAWIKTTDTASWFLSFNTSSGGNNLLYGISSNTLTFYDGSSHTGTATINDGSWHHVVGVLDDTNNLVKTYVDGVLDQSTACSSTIAATDKFSIGQEWDGGSTSDFLNGQIDDAKIYNYALNSTQIKTLYNSSAIRFGPATGSP